MLLDVAGGKHDHLDFLFGHAFCVCVRARAEGCRLDHPILQPSYFDPGGLLLDMGSEAWYVSFVDRGRQVLTIVITYRIAPIDYLALLLRLLHGFDPRYP